MASAPSPNDLTRQQLDELDALLQRMLAMPQMPAPAPSTQPLPGWRADRPVTGPAPRMPHLAAPPVAPPELGNLSSELTLPNSQSVTSAELSMPALPTANLTPRPLSESTPSSKPPEPVAAMPMPAPKPSVPVEPVMPRPMESDTVELKTATTPAPVMSSPMETRVPMEPMAPLTTPAVSSVETYSRPIPAFHLPIYCLNWILERILGIFGPPGQALTTPGTKYFLGVLGILMMAAAALWTARGLGWIKITM